MATRVYGHDKTIHRTTAVNVEVHDGRVVAVWFRCQPLPFDQHEASPRRQAEMDALYASMARGSVQLLAVEIQDDYNEPTRIPETMMVFGRRQGFLKRLFGRS